jgi:hypothetical protein
MKVVQANGAAVTINFGECTLEQLVANHNDMCLTAADFGLSANTVESFASVEEGIAACERLHGSIVKARERAAAPPKKQRASAKAKAKKAAVEKIAADAGAVVAGYTEPSKEKVVKKAKSAKKSAKKVAAKKVTAKKASNGGGTRKRLSDDTTITWLAEGNPARKDSIFYDRVEKVRKAKTVGAIKKAGGIAADATECAKRGWAKLSA